MLFSVQTPWRGSQEGYEAFAACLEKQTLKDFEWVVANDCYDMDPIKPLKTSFPHTVVRIPSRLPGWAYSIARNVCIDFGDPKAMFLIYIDGDVRLFPTVVEEVAKVATHGVIVRGYKHYFDKAGNLIDVKRKNEVMVLPYDLVRASGGFDEIFFPWYGYSYRDMMRRMAMKRKTKDVWCKGLAGACVKSEIKYDRDSTTNAVLMKRMEKIGTKYPIMRATTAREVVWKHGY